MKNAVIILLMAICFSAGAQNFEKYYPYLAEGSGDFVFAYDDGYAIAGFSNKNNIGDRLFVLRTNLSGDTLWTKNFGIGGNSYIECSEKDENGNIYLSLHNADSADLIKFTSDWEIIWMRKYDPSIKIKQMKLSADNNLLMLGHTYAPNALYSTVCLYKLNFDGKILWQSDTLSIHGGFEYCPAIVEMENKNIAVIVNLTYLFEYPPLESLIYYLSSSGDSISTAALPELVLCDTYAIGNELLSVANIYKTPIKNSLIRFSPDGTILFQKQLKSPENTDFYKFLQVSDDKFVALGTTSTEDPLTQRIVLHGLSDTGDSLWSNFIGSSSRIWAIDIANCKDHGFVATGMSTISEQEVPLLVKTDANGNTSSLGTNNINKPENISIYPNPATDYMVFESGSPQMASPVGSVQSPQQAPAQYITITDICGRPVANVPVSGVKTVWDARGIIPGIYFYSMEIKGLMINGKIMIIR